MNSHDAGKKKPSVQDSVARANWLARKEQGFAGLPGHGAGKHHTREHDAEKGRGGKPPKHKQDWSAERYAEEPTLTQPLMTRPDYGTAGDSKMATDLRSKLIRLAHANPALRADILPLLKEASFVDGKPHCDMNENCNQPVTHLDKDGYVYCEKHAAQRKSGGVPTRKLKPAELKKLEQGQAVSKYAALIPVEVRLASLRVKLSHRPQLEREGLNSRAVAEELGAMLYFIDSEKNHSKYYEMIIKPEGGMFVLKKRWGALTDKGDTGRGDEKIEMFPSLAKAQAALRKTYEQKTGKGYKDAFNRMLHRSPATGEVLPLGQYPVGLTRTVGFGWGTQSATKCLPSLRELQTKIDGALGTLSEDSNLSMLLADLQAADRIINGLMRNPEAVDVDTNRSMGDILAKALATPMNRIQGLMGMARTSPGRAPIPDQDKLRKELTAIKNYINKQLSYCA